MEANAREFVLITGATGGLGRSTAQALARRGSSLIVGGRRVAAVAELCDELSKAHGIQALPFVADLSDLEQVRDAIGSIEGIALAAIITNAGLSTLQDSRTKQGFELTFGVNVLAHQLVLSGLISQVVEGGRVIVLSSGVHEPDNKLARRAGVPLPQWVGTRDLALPDEADVKSRLKPGPLRYSTSKLANVLQARGWQQQLRADARSVDVFAVDPGLMIDTDLARELPFVLRPIFKALGYALTPFVDNMRLSTTTAGYLASLALDDKWNGTGFQYFDGIHAKAPSPDALRDDYMQELWQTSNELVRSPPS